MKAIFCEKPNDLRMKDIPSPVRRPGEALLRLRRVGICGTDLHAFKGNQPYFTYPRILGHELSAEIAEVDANESGLRAGDPVVIIPYLECGTCIACRQGKTNCCTSLRVLGVHQEGGMQEYMTLPADHLIKTTSLSFDQMAMVECLGIGCHSVWRSQLKAGETALVVGAGPIGIGVMQFAKEAGAKVIVMDVIKDRLDFCAAHFKVDHFIHVQGDPVPQIEALTGGDFPHVVFDATGNAKSMMSAFNYVSNGGRYVLVSLVKDQITFYDPDFHRHELTLMSSRNATRKDMEHVIRSVEAGAVDASSLVTHRAAFDETIDRFESWLKPETKVVKAVVEF